MFSGTIRIFSLSLFGATVFFHATSWRRNFHRISDRLVQKSPFSLHNFTINLTSSGVFGVLVQSALGEELFFGGGPGLVLGVDSIFVAAFS